MFFVQGGILCHRHRHLDSTITQIVIPAKYQLAIVKAIHHSSVGGHLGQAKTVSMLMNLGYYFPRMRSIVNRVVSTCHQCQRANAHKNTNLASFAANMAPFPSAKWRIISSDLIGPFTATPEGYRYAMIVIMMDTFTKYAISYSSCGAERHNRTISLGLSPEN